MSLPAGPGPRSAGSAPAPPHILVVDDDDYVHATIVAALRPLRADVSRAATAAEALIITRNQLPISRSWTSASPMPTGSS